MSGHTSAPWHVSQRPHTKGPPSTDPADAHLDYFHIEAGRDEEDGGWEIAGYMRPADARLIAAAPQMLAALKALNLQTRNWSSDEIRQMGMETTLTMMLDAIAKAEGK